MCVCFITGVVIHIASHVPSPWQLKRVLLQEMLPFIGFGFLDNAIMIGAVSVVQFAHELSHHLQYYRLRSVTQLCHFREALSVLNTTITS